LPGVSPNKERDNLKITAAIVLDQTTGSSRRVPCEYFISTVPVLDLIESIQPEDERVRQIAGQLPYRDFMTVGLLVRRMSVPAISQYRPAGNGMPPDNWIYIQEPDVKIGRLQIFNNWSPSLVADPDTIWLGLEYFCNAGDELWAMQSTHFIDYAAMELERIGLINRKDVIDGTLVRVPKAYPAYFGSYSQFDHVRTYLDQFSNLYPVGRNGMHRYNNQDHSMLTANGAVNSIINGGANKEEIWRINADGEYHEEIRESDKAHFATRFAS
jgi:protoporphyrinogen oxidase